MASPAEFVIEQIVGGITYDLFRHAVQSLIVALAATAIFRWALNKLKRQKELMIFVSGTFIVCMALFYLIGNKPIEPNIGGEIQSAISGLATSDRDTIAVFSINLINTGTMQSIAKKWRVEASANGRKYDAVFPPMPKSFTFNNIPNINRDQPTSLIFKSEDNILEKALAPIQIGAMLPGVLFVVFQNVDQSVFRSGADYTISYEDALSKTYTMSIKSSGKIDNVAFVPGLHTEAVCPIPSGGLSTIGNDLMNSLRNHDQK